MLHMTPPTQSKAYEVAANVGQPYASAALGANAEISRQVRASINALMAAYAPGWTMHKLRHAFISEVYDDSGDLGVAQTAARHKSADTTRGYALLSDRRLRGIIDGLDGGLSPAA